MWIKYFGGSRTASGGQRRNPMRTGTQAWGKNPRALPGGVGITTNMFNAVEEFMQDFKNAPNNFRYGEAALVMLLAKTTQGFAQKLSRGPNVGPSGGSQMRLVGRTFVVDSAGTATPTPQWSSQAWKIPVRRITSRYYQGWKVRRIAPNIWQVYNATREAYFIEFGLHPTSTRKRPRRIRSLAVVRTLQFVQQTQAAHRMLDLVLGSKGPISASKLAAQSWGGFSSRIPTRNMTNG